MNDKRNVLLLYLLDRHIQLQMQEGGIGGWGGGGGGIVLEYTYFSRLVKAIIRILQPFLPFFFH